MYTFGLPTAVARSEKEPGGARGGQEKPSCQGASGALRSPYRVSWLPLAPPDSSWILLAPHGLLGPPRS